MRDAKLSSPRRSGAIAAGTALMVRRHSLFLGIVLAVLFAGGCDEPAQVEKPPPCANCANSPDELISLLAQAYQDRDYQRYSELFPGELDSVEFFFVLDAPVNGIDSWDLAEELRIHRRMFDPSHPLPGEHPVPHDYWLRAVPITLSRIASMWNERTDLYKSPTNPTGLDASKWRVSEAEFHADLLFETEGDTDYRVDGRENFIVIQDLRKTAPAARRYLLYRWEDLDPPPFPLRRIDTTPTHWSAVKALYK